MHKDLRELLHSAEGNSRHVVVIFVDVRGFSSFAKIAESSDAAEFLKSVYTKILDEYFEDADFFKLTGDGMLILYQYDRESLANLANQTVSTSMRLVGDFPTLCDDDPMVNFEVPDGLGIGLARGAATSLTSGGKVLDYSGRPLNLAARLMDLARPSGVVFDSSFGPAILDGGIAGEFEAQSVYIKGIAEEDPVIAYVLKGAVDIPDFNRQPINRFHQFTEKAMTKSLSEWAERPNFNMMLTHEPADKDDILVMVISPKPTKSGGPSKTLKQRSEFKGRYRLRAQKHRAVIDSHGIVARLQRAGVKRTWPVEITIEYPIRPSIEND